MEPKQATLETENKIQKRMLQTDSADANDGEDGQVLADANASLDIGSIDDGMSDITTEPTASSTRSFIALASSVLLCFLFLN
jgi:hypothetical protein